MLSSLEVLSYASCMSYISMKKHVKYMLYAACAGLASSYFCAYFFQNTCIFCAWKKE